MSTVTTWWVLQVLLGMGTVAALWWALRSGESAGWAIFFCLGSINISVAVVAGRAARGQGVGGVAKRSGSPDGAPKRSPAGGQAS